MIDFEKPVCEVLTDEMKDKRFTIIVKPFTFGQFRIQICGGASDESCPKGHGSIIHNLCTYRFERMLMAVVEFSESKDINALYNKYLEQDPHGRTDLVRLDFQK